MKKKLGLLFIVAVIASAGIGVSYASFNGGYVIGGFPSCYCDVAFVGDVFATDSDDDTKNIGDVQAWLTDEYPPSTGLYNGIGVEITGAYPCYEVYIDFTVKNAGERLLDVGGITLENYNHSAMLTHLSGPLSDVGSLLPGEEKDGRLTIIVLNEAKMNWLYEFEIGLGFSGEDCCPDPDLANGGFEEPVVTHSKKWDIFGSGTYGLEWTVDWHGGSTTYQGQTRPEPALLELHRGVSGWLPHEDEQYAELDTDWDGPDGGLSGEPASVKISQVVVSCPWRTYTLAFSWSPRPGHADNGLKVYWDGAEIFDSGIVSGVGNGNTDWHIETITGLTVTGVSTSIEFVETGNPDSLGMFLDAVSVQLE